jgi:hypothetical protein
MAHSLSFTEGRKITPEDAERWTEELSNILNTSHAQHKFTIYFQLQELKSEQAVLQFWEKCNTFLLKPKESNHHTQGWSQRYMELNAW